MNASEWSRVRAAFERALELPEAGRSASLDRALGDHPELLAAAQRLLDADRQAGGFLTPPGPTTLAAAATVLIGPRTGDRFGPFELLRVIGEGGMGTVFEARQDVPSRSVALKLMRSGLGSEDARRRFRDEIEMLGRLEHPGIARVLAGGVEGVQPWFAMELLEDAQPVTTWVRSRGLPLRARLELFAAVVDAIAHAHRRGVIHCDLKPANILVDRHGRAKVIDFGIARAAVGTDAGEDVGMFGTLLYMSPERLAGAAADADVRSDVWGLGVVLFEILAGRPPFAIDGSSVASAQAAIAAGAPRPSALADLPVELDWIVQRALERDRERRYPSADALREDLRRFAGDQSLLAAPPSAVYRLRKLVRRHRAASVATIAAVVIALAAFVAVTTALVRTRRAEASEREGKEVARASATRAEAALSFLLDVFGTAAPGSSAKGRDLTMAEGLAIAAADFDRRFEDEPEIRMALGRAIGLAYLALGDLEPAEHHLRGALALYERHAGGDAAITAELRLDLVSLLTEHGDLDDALRELGLAEAVLARHADHRAGLTARVQRGRLLLRSGARDEAVAALRDAVVAFDRAGPGSERDALIATNLLAGALHERGELDAALPLYDRALHGLARLKGEEHPDTLAAMSNYALLLFSRRPSAESVAVLERVLTVRERVLGPEHFETLMVLASLGSQAYMLGDRATAATRWELALQRASTSLPREHPIRVSLLSNLAALRRDEGEFERAESLQREVLALRREQLGDDHEQARLAQIGLAEVLRFAGRFDEARAEYEACLTAVRAAEPEQVPNTYRCLLGLGRVAAAQQDFAAAETALIACRELYDRAVARLAVKSMLLRPERELLSLYEAWGRSGEAARYRKIVDDPRYEERAGMR